MSSNSIKFKVEVPSDIQAFIDHNTCGQINLKVCTPSDLKRTREEFDESLNDTVKVHKSFISDEEFDKILPKKEEPKRLTEEFALKLLEQYKSTGNIPTLDDIKLESAITPEQPIIQPIDTIKKNDRFSLIENDFSNGISVSLMTLILFNKLEWSDNRLSVLIACKHIQNNITVEKVSLHLKTHLKTDLSNQTINSHLQILSNYHYLKSIDTKTKNLTKYEHYYYLQNEYHTTKTYCEQIDFKINYNSIKNFYDSKILINDTTIKHFNKTNHKTIKLYLFEDIIANLYYFAGVTKYQIKHDLLLNLNEINSIYKDGNAIHEIVKFTVTDENSGRLSGSDIPICVGKKITKPKYYTKLKISKFIKHKIQFDDNSYYDNEKNREAYLYEKYQFDKRNRINLDCQLSGLERRRYLGSIHYAYSSDWRKTNLFGKLSDISFTYKIKNAMGILKKPISISKILRTVNLTKTECIRT